MAVSRRPQPHLHLVGRDDEDAVLLDAVYRRAPEAMAALYDRLRPLIARTIRRLAPRSLDANDLEQEVFVGLVEALLKRPVIESLDAWAMTLCARVVFHRVRRQRLEHRFSSPEQLSDLVLPSPHAGPDTTAAQRHDLARLVELLETMPFERVQAFLLHDVHGFGLKEIAAVLDITVANAQTRLSRGRRDVHEALASTTELRALLRGDGHD